MGNKLIREIQRIVGAFIFYSRIPFPSNWISTKTSNCSRYFSLVGWFVGGVTVSTFLISQIIFSDSSKILNEVNLPISILLGMIVSVLLTGALHEDGFVDTCDGIAGGWTSEERIKIMKDSRIGTYGAVGLVMLVLVKFFTLLHIENEILPYVWFAGNAISRFVSISQLLVLDYVQDTSMSKSGQMTNVSIIDLITNAIFGLLPLLFIALEVWLVFAVLAVLWFFLVILFKRTLGGTTGDCLGATQQLSEVVFYLCLASKFST